MDIKEAILNILNGSSIDDEVGDLVHEKRVCRYQGPPMRRKSKGRTYYVRKRVCTGRADPRRSQRSRRAGRAGGVKQRRKFAQRARWRGQLKRQETVLPGQKKRKKLRRKRHK